MRTIPELIVERLRAAGIAEAVITVPERIGDRYEPVLDFAPAARAFFARAAGNAVGTGVQPACVIVGTEVQATWETAGQVAVPAVEADALPWVVATDFETWGVGICADRGLHGMWPHASLTAAGASWSAADVARRMRSQRNVIRAHAGELAWAGVTVEVDARRLFLPSWEDRLSQPGVHLPRVEDQADVLVPDAMWCQVLSAGHLRRLGGPPHPGAVELPGARIEVTFGEPEQWLPGHPDRDELRARGQRAKAGCLVSREEAGRMFRTRGEEARRRDPELFRR